MTACSSVLRLDKPLLIPGGTFSSVVVISEREELNTEEVKLRLRDNMVSQLLQNGRRQEGFWPDVE